MILIALTGAIGHGKSTFAEALHVHEPNVLHLETNMPIIAVANEVQQLLKRYGTKQSAHDINQWLQMLPAVVERLLGRALDTRDVLITDEIMQRDPVAFEKLHSYLSQAQKNPALLDIPITAHNKAEFRPILQWIGGYLIERVDPLIWIGEVIEQARDYEATGGQLAVIGGVRSVQEAQVVQGANGYVIEVIREGQAATDVQDPTERTRSDITPAVTVYNNGAVTDLIDVAGRILADIRSGTLQESYRAI